MKPFIVAYLKWPSKVTSGHRQRYPSFDRLTEMRSPRTLYRDEKVGHTYVRIKITVMTLKIDQGHWQWHSPVGYISLSITGL